MDYNAMTNLQKSILIIEDLLYKAKGRKAPKIIVDDTGVVFPGSPEGIVLSEEARSSPVAEEPSVSFDAKKQPAFPDLPPGKMYRRIPSKDGRTFRITIVDDPEYQKKMSELLAKFPSRTSLRKSISNIAEFLFSEAELRDVKDQIDGANSLGGIFGIKTDGNMISSEPDTERIMFSGQDVIEHFLANKNKSKLLAALIQRGEVASKRDAARENGLSITPEARGAFHLFDSIDKRGAITVKEGDAILRDAVDKILKERGIIS